MTASSYAPFSAYRDLLGQPRKGLHKWRVPVLDLAAVDLAATMIASYYLTRRPRSIRRVTISFLLLWSAGAILHKMFAIHEPLPQDEREFIRNFKDRVADLRKQEQSSREPSWREAMSAFGINYFMG